MKNRFQVNEAPPYWEGLVVPGMERGDKRMIVQAAAPSEALAPFIQSVWALTWDIPEGTEVNGIVVPTPCVHLMALSVPAFQKLPLFHDFLGVKNKGMVTAMRGRGQSFGVEFRPGGLFPFLDLEMKNWPAINLPGKATMPEMPDAPECPWTIDALSEWLGGLEKTLEVKIPGIRENHLDAITAVFAHLFSSEASPSVDDLADVARTSKRSLQRIFAIEVGLSLKDSIRVARFHKALKGMSKHDAVSLADLSLNSGFYDQPHMVNEFKKLVEACPAKFKKYW
ncbi:MAG: DUF6597 domain-containing transcriptional factor [Bdellovibrionota bacterium]